MQIPAPDKPGARISKPIRVLAWVLLVLSVAVGVGMAVMLFKNRGAPGAQGTVTSLLLIVVMIPVWAYAALKGSSPRWLSFVEDRQDEEIAGRDVRLGALTSLVSMVTTVIVFGLALIFFGRKLGIFEGETGWFGAAVFFVAWVVVLLILWRNHRRGAR